MQVSRPALQQGAGSPGGGLPCCLKSPSLQWAGLSPGWRERWGTEKVEAPSEAPPSSGLRSLALEAVLVPHLCLSPTLTTTLSDSETCVSSSGERSTSVGSRGCFPRRESERWCCAGRGVGNPAQHHQPPCSWIPRLCPMNQLQVLVLWKYNFCSYFIKLNCCSGFGPVFWLTKYKHSTSDT